MPRISTDNYDTVASWNGSQDLFVVEQPDGTKVATPAMVKQFIEAGDFAATGNIEDGDGNQLADIATKLGDPASASGVTGDDAFAKISALNSNLVATRTNITPQTGVNTDNNNKCYYEKVAGVVNVVINVKGLTAGTVSRICTLPEGYRPYSRITSAADDAGSGSGRSFVVVDASGNVDAYTSATQYVSGQLTFVAYS